MLNPRVVVYTCAVLLTGQLAQAQEKPSYTFATYYRCDVAKEARADAIFKETIAPLLDKQVKEGRLTDFGWNRHWLGGAWRRLEYMQGTNLEAMIDARDQYIAALQSQRAASDEFDAICGSHDDYIWQTGAQSPATAAPPPVSMSTYYQCESNEVEADAIFKTALAPVLNQHVKDGKIASWSWLQHMAGGLARRVLVLRAGSHKAILNYWSALDQALETAQPDLSKRFSSICFAHTDYIWDYTPR
jgi:hypothetical protein